MTTVFFTALFILEEREVLVAETEKDSTTSSIHEDIRYFPFEAVVEILAALVGPLVSCAFQLHLQTQSSQKNPAMKANPIS